MMDYPIFLGTAAYLAMTSLGCTSLLGLRPFDVARIGAAVTLLWASIEKWAYPEWTYPNCTPTKTCRWARSALLHDRRRDG